MPASADPRPSTFGAGGGFALLDAGARLVACLPWRALPWLGALLGVVAGGVLRIRRAHVEGAMRVAGIPRAHDAAAAMYRSLGASLVELMWMAARPNALAAARIVMADADRAVLEAARKGGRGAVVAASHTGNWELAAAAIAEIFGLTAIVKPLHTPAVDAFMRRARHVRGLRAATPEGAIGVAREALARGELVAMVIDQVPLRTRHAVRGAFLGAAASLDRAPAVIAAKTGAPLVVTAAAREGSVQRLHVLAVLTPPPDPRARARWIAGATADANRALERFVRAHPSEWLWLHRRWRAPADARPDAKM